MPLKMAMHVAFLIVWVDLAQENESGLLMALNHSGYMFVTCLPDWWIGIYIHAP